MAWVLLLKRGDIEKHTKLDTFVSFYHNAMCKNMNFQKSAAADNLLFRLNMEKITIKEPLPTKLEVNSKSTLLKTVSVWMHFSYCTLCIFFSSCLLVGCVICLKITFFFYRCSGYYCELILNCKIYNKGNITIFQ